MEDKNKLNEFSVKIAKYFYRILHIYSEIVNSYEVRHLGRLYVSLKQYTPFYVLFHRNKKDNVIFGGAIIRDVYINPAPLFHHIFSYYDNVLDWNHFFQFIMYFSLSPMISIFYTIIRTFPDADRKISWNQIYNFSSLLETDNFITTNTYNKFVSLDLNNDGKLSFSQFFKFVTETYELWEPLYLFKVALVMRYFPKNMYITILERRKKINLIKEYQLRNMNKLPSLNCNETVINLLCGKPNPNRYDYDNETTGGSVIYNQIVTVFIKQFDPNHSSRRVGFSCNYLKAFNRFEIIYTIDQYFLLYYQEDVSKIKEKQKMEQSKTLVSMYDSYLSESSCYTNKSNNESFCGLSGRKATTTKSILRATSAVITKSSRRTNADSNTINNAATTTTTTAIITGISNNNNNNSDNNKLHKAVSQQSAISAASALHASLYPSSHVAAYHQNTQPSIQQKTLNNTVNNAIHANCSPKYYRSTPLHCLVEEKSVDDKMQSLLPGMIPTSPHSLESNHSTLNEDSQNDYSDLQI